MATQIVFILDRSGSMEPLTDDVIGGFNSFISEQKKLKGKIKLTTILFDNVYETLHDGINIEDVNPISKKEYNTRGCTALLDAVGQAINTMDAHAKKKDRVLFVINTDGYENASREYTNKQIKELVENHEKKNSWKFIYIGANVDAFAAGGDLGIKMTANYTSTSVGTASVYCMLNNVVSNYSNNASYSITQDDFNKASDELK